MTQIRVALTLVLLAVSCNCMAAGGIRYNHNRIIYNQGADSETIKVSNGGEQLYLLQSGVVMTPDSNDIGPFWVTPPIARLEGNSQNILRVIGRTDLLSALPRDRESLFYFFSTAIPAQSETTSGNAARLSIGMKTLLKLFYRPKGLPGAVQDTVNLLQVVNRNGELVFKNPTAFYASFASLSLNGKAVNLDKQASMIAPYGEVKYAGFGQVRQASWRLMTDYGGVSDEKKVVLEN